MKRSYSECQWPLGFYATIQSWPVVTRVSHHHAMFSVHLVLCFKCHWPLNMKSSSDYSGGCFTNVSRALQNNLAKMYSSRNHIYGENFKLKLCTCAQSMALGTRTKFQLEILTRSTISTIYIFRDNCLESSRNVNETPPPLNIMSAKATDITDFDNSLSLVSCQAIIWTNDDLLLIASLGKNKWKLNKCAPIPNQENWF